MTLATGCAMALCSLASASTQCLPKYGQKRQFADAYLTRTVHYLHHPTAQTAGHLDVFTQYHPSSSAWTAD